MPLKLVGEPIEVFPLKGGLIETGVRGNLLGDHRQLAALKNGKGD